MTVRKKLVLHVGLPKTGTSALQFWCNQNRDRLLAQDIDYPQPTDGAVMPKHQFLVGSLKTNRLERLASLLEASQTGTLVLSTEGLTNHLYDFRPAALKAFRELTEHYDLNVFLVVREPNTWLKSYYKQAVINPPSIPDFHWATDLRLEEFSTLPRIQRLMDHEALQEDVHIAFGASKVIVARYEDDWMSTFLETIEIGKQSEFTKLNRIHLSVDDDLVEIIRQVNGMRLPAKDRSAFLATLRNCLKIDHDGLKYDYTGSDRRVISDRQILVRLTPTTSAQSVIIESLDEWLSTMTFERT